jgi:hypothetical protein
MITTLKPFLNKSGIYFLVIILSIVYFAGVKLVPFHPDESTYIFMSTDFDQFLTRPSDLFWSIDKVNDIRQKYRELDAPIARYLIGLGRMLTGQNALKADWNWSKSWEDNRLAGALPDEGLLLIARLSVSSLFPLSLILLIQITRSIANRRAAWFCVILFSSNALILLHTRRAMAESAEIFTILLFLWAVVKTNQRVWLIGLPAGLAFCSKQSLGILILVGYVWIVWIGIRNKNKSQKILRHIAIYTLIFVGVIFIFNPFLWNDPLSAITAAISARQNLLHRQVTEIGSFNPDQILNNYPLRILSLIAQVFINQPAIAEVGNYLLETNASQIIYFSNPLNQLFRGVISGGIFLTLSIIGFLLNFFEVLNRRIVLNIYSVCLLLSAFLQAIVLIILLPIPWQRYYIALVPFSCIWISYLVDQIITFINSHNKLIGERFTK